MSENSSFFVTTEWLAEHLNDPGLSVVDASWYLPTQQRNGKAEYDAGHIPRAVFFDQDVVVEPGSALPHTLPSPRVFSTFASSMGISADDTIVVYDGPGLYSAPRVWWMFRVMGARKVFLLEGGIDRWKAEGRHVTRTPTKIAPSYFDVDFDRGKVASFDEMMRIVAEGSAQVVDARPAGRFAGSEPEPRKGIRSGHMPGARSLPGVELSRDGKLLPFNELRRKFEEAGVDLEKPIVTSCGSGVVAAVASLALETLGHRNHKLYDGSWTEWGGRDDTPVETGTAAPTS
jgi:thiosulfate/3-mercaptopyruvate sulfurtransferase